MKIRIPMTLLALLALVPFAAIAQEDESPKPFVYATYMNCDADKQWMVDAVVKDVYKPVYDKAVEDGVLLGWGWLAHHTGGEWRRLLYRSVNGSSTGTRGPAVFSVYLDCYMSEEEDLRSDLQ